MKGRASNRSSRLVLVGGALLALLGACAAEVERPRGATGQAPPASAAGPVPVASGAAGAPPVPLAAPASTAAVVTFVAMVDRTDGARFDVVRFDLPPAAREALVEVAGPAGWAITREWEDSDGFWDRGRLQAGVEVCGPAGTTARPSRSSPGRPRSSRRCRPRPRGAGRARGRESTRRSGPWTGAGSL